MSSLWRTYCRPKVSPIHGIGVFAVQPIKKGTILMNAKNMPGTWKTLEWAFEHEVEPGVIKLMQDYVFHAEYRDSHVFVPNEPVDSFHAQMLMNHSKNPNIFVNSRFQLEALKDIQIDEELTENYLHLSTGLNGMRLH